MDTQTSELVHQSIDDVKLYSFLLQQQFKSLSTSLGFSELSLDKPSDELKEEERMSSDTVRSETRPEIVSIEPEITKVEQVSYQLITEYKELERWCSIAENQGLVAIDTETTSINAASADLVGVSLAISPGRACYIPLQHTPAYQSANQVGLDFTDTSENETKVYQQIDFNKAMNRLKQLLEDKSVLKVGHNLKYDSHILKQKRNGNITIFPLDDTMCLSYVLDAGRIERHGLDYLAAKWLKHQTIKYEDICGKGSKQVSFDQISPSDACNYAAEDADITFRLWMILKPRLANERMTVVYNRLERPLIQVLSEMEQNGIVVDASILRRLSNDFASKIVLLQREIYNRAEQEFNIASPKQLGEILFEKLK